MRRLGPLPGPKYVCMRTRPCMARPHDSSPSQNPVFLTPSSETSVDGRFRRIRRLFLSFLLVWGLSLVFYLLSWALKTPLNQYGKAHYGLFLSSQKVMSLIQPRPASD